MWGANDNTHASSRGQNPLHGGRQTGDTSTPLRQGTGVKNYIFSTLWLDISFQSIQSLD